MSWTKRLPAIAAVTALTLICGTVACGRSGQEQAPPASSPAPSQPGTAAAPGGSPGQPPAGQTRSGVPDVVSPHETKTPGTTTELPPGHPPIPQGGSGMLEGPPSGSGTGAKALAWTVPKGWVSEPPSNPMRKAQYRVPGPGGDAQLVVNYFGPGQGGDPMDNAVRWAEQFGQPGGGDPREAMTTQSLDVGGIKVLEVETTGTYNGGSMMMGGSPPEPKPDWALLGAVAEGPDARWFFKLTGPKATVQAQRAAFFDMVKSLKPGA